MSCNKEQMRSITPLSFSVHSLFSNLSSARPSFLKGSIPQTRSEPAHRLSRLLPHCSISCLSTSRPLIPDKLWHTIFSQHTKHLNTHHSHPMYNDSMCFSFSSQEFSWVDDCTRSPFASAHLTWLYKDCITLSSLHRLRALTDTHFSSLAALFLSSCNHPTT